MTRVRELSAIQSPPFDATSPVRQVLLRLWRTRGLNRAFNASLSYAPHRLRSWVEAERERIRKAKLDMRIRERTRLVPESDLRSMLARGLGVLVGRRGRASIGDYLEFGVYHGTSLTCMYRELERASLRHVRLFGFDSFQGFPPEAAQEDGGRWQPGRCCSPLELTTAVLEAEGIDRTRVTLVPGWFRDTLNAETKARHRIAKASVIMIDCDLYSSTREALDFCAPLIRDEALVLFDEYYPKGLEEKNIGEKKAFQEFLEERSEFEAVPFGSYAPRTQAFLLSRRR